MQESQDAPFSSRSASEPAGDGTHDLAASARGWHRIQLAVLGFIGFCGVMWASGDPDGPGWLQWISATLVVGALALACLAIYVVGRVAYPWRHPAPAGGARRLRAGITLTYAAVVVLVVATLSAWWPSPAPAGEVEARDTTGATWCGDLVAAPAGAVRIDTTDGPVTLALRDLVAIRSVATC